jgi:ubiquinone/menaquinone biosynthesis C-methylase UbiE
MTPPHRPATAPNFDRVAAIYRWGEWISFGPWLSRCRLAFLHRLGDARRALIIGDGDGRFTARLLRNHPSVEIDTVDSSRAMLKSLLRRAGQHRARVHPQLMDARQWQCAGPPRYDLVVTHFFLDCLSTEEIRALAAAVRPSLKPDARWLVSEFAIPPGRFGRLVAAPLVWLLYWVFGLLTGLSVRRLPDYRAALRASGFDLVESRTWLRGLLVSELWNLERQNKNRLKTPMG